MKTLIVNSALEIGSGIVLGQTAIEAAPNQEPWVYIATTLIPIVATSLVSIIKSIWGTPEQRQAKREARHLRRLEKERLKGL